MCEIDRWRQWHSAWRPADTLTSGRVLPEDVASLPLVLSSPSVNALQIPMVGVVEATVLKDPAAKRQDEMRRCESIVERWSELRGCSGIACDETGWRPAWSWLSIYYSYFNLRLNLPSPALGGEMLRRPKVSYTISKSSSSSSSLSCFAVPKLSLPGSLIPFSKANLARFFGLKLPSWLLGLSTPLVGASRVDCPLSGLRSRSLG